jgi:hypothetical protein
MKMVKSLLLGSAAGLVAVTAGQAADLPVKAKPVEYVKVCSLYGAGFYYMPGTDMCIKIGGWTRAEYGWDFSGNLATGPWNGVGNSRNQNNSTFRARGYITADAREQTAYGTARAYIDVGINTNDVGLNTAANQFSSNRAFLQWAGITAGLTQSFYDFYSVPAASLSGYFPASDTGDPGWFVAGYTAQLGNGLSATVSAEERRMTQIINVDPANISALAFGGFFGGVGGGSTIGSIGGTSPGGFPNGANTDGIGTNPTIAGVFPGAGAYGGFQSPDIIGNLRLDQTWGSAQVMGALHEVNASYYGVSSINGTSAVTSGTPGQTWGFAVGGGLRLNFPMIAQGDYFQSQVNYSQGAMRYLFFTPDFNWGNASGRQEGYGVLSDAVYGSTGGTFATGTGLNLTTGWGFNASFEHYWTPAVHESFLGGYSAVSYNTQANNQLCAIENGGLNGGPALPAGASGAVATPGCNNNWSTWYAGSRLQWDITKSFYIGVEGLYSQIHSATPNATNTLVSNASGGASPATQALGIAGSAVSTGLPGAISDVGVWTVRVRMHKDFLP